MDLFSGDVKRMERAVSCLLMSPQNNLKIFKNGTIVYDDRSSVEDLAGVLSEWLDPDKSLAGSQCNRQFFCKIVCDALLQSHRQGPLVGAGTTDDSALELSLRVVPPRINPETIATVVEILGSTNQVCFISFYYIILHCMQFEGEKNK